MVLIFNRVHRRAARHGIQFSCPVCGGDCGGYRAYRVYPRAAQQKFEPLFVVSYAYMILELFVYFLFWGADVLPSDRIIDGVNLKSLWSGEVENPDFYLDEKSYALFLLSAFALYQKDMANGDYTSIRQFDNFV